MMKRYLRNKSHQKSAFVSLKHPKLGELEQVNLIQQIQKMMKLSRRPMNPWG